MTEQPSGTVTLLFSDIEGSTRLLHELGPQRYREALVEHRRLLREAFARYGGYEVDYEGDSFFVAFADAAAAVAAADEAQAALEAGPTRVPPCADLRPAWSASRPADGRSRRRPAPAEWRRSSTGARP